MKIEIANEHKLVGSTATAARERSEPNSSLSVKRDKQYMAL